MKYKKICLDPGHGGKDSGAAANGLLEDSLNLTVAKELGIMLKKAGWSVTYTRTTDVFIPLGDRVKIAQKAGSELFISIHHNAGGGIGWEVIYEVDDKETKKLAECIGKEFTKNDRPKHGTGVYSKTDRTGKEDYFAVLRNGKIDGVITEYAYLDSRDHNSVDSALELKKEAEAIFKGIQEFNK